MKRIVLLGALVVSVVCVAPASAEVVVNGTAELTFVPADVSVAVGETVTWQFPDTTQAHNVNSDGATVDDPDWTAFKPNADLPAPPQTFTFKTEGVYKFICSVHTTTMFGTVTVGAAAPPPVRVLLPSELPFQNDASPLGALERVDEDTAKPSLSSLSARRSARGAARVRFRVSEESVVSVRLRRAGRTVKTLTQAGSGRFGVTASKLKAGRYSIEVQATDLAGNRSTLRKLALTVR